MARKNKEIKVNRAFRFKSGDISFNLWYKGVDLYSITRKENNKGEFWYSFPARQDKDGNWWKYFYVPFTDEEVEDIEDQIQDLLDD